MSCNKGEEGILSPVDPGEELTIETYLRFKTETYEKLCTDNEFLRICNLYAREKDKSVTSWESYDSILNLAWNYGETLDYCKNNSLMVYVFRYIDDRDSNPSTKYDLGEVIVEGDYEYLRIAYRYAYYDVTDLEENVLHIVEPWGARSNDIYFTIKRYIPQSETELYFLIKESGLHVEIFDLLYALRKTSSPGNFEYYLSNYHNTFARIVYWAQKELERVFLQGGTSGGSSGSGSSGGSDPLLPTPYASAFCHSASTLTPTQMVTLNQALMEFIAVCPEFKLMYDKLVELGIKINFMIDPSIFEEQGGKAGYQEKKMYFRDDACINVDNLQEEMIHAIQEVEIYGVATMENSRKNMEFEAKVMQDILNIKYDMGRWNMGSVGQTNKFMNDYAAWIEKKNIDRTLFINKFHEFCTSWTGYGGTYNSVLQPKLLINYLNF